MVKSQPFLTDDDLQKLLNAPMQSHPVHRYKINTLIQLLWDSGARISEITNLKVKDFDSNRRFLTFRSTKNKEDRIIPITPEMNKRLTRIVAKKQPDQRIFGMGRIAGYTALKRRVERSGINKNIRPHTFRHRFITDKLNKKLPLFKVQHFVGHKSAQSTSHYYHFTTESLQEVLEA